MISSSFQANRPCSFLAWGLLILLALPSCAYIRQSFSKAPPAPSSAVGLTEAVKQNTRTGKVYALQDFSTVLLVSALYKDWSVQEAYVREYARAHRMGLEEEARFLEKERAVHSTHREFLVALYSSNDAWADLQKKDPVWKVYLYQGEGRFTPERVEVADPPSALAYKFYDFVTPWTKVYSIKFPPGGGRTLRLVFVSWLGEVELTWEPKE